MVAVRKTRKQIERERAKQAKHYEYIKDYRGDVGSPYRLEENKRRVMNRVAKGARPAVPSMIKFDITLEDVNDLRQLHGLEPLVINVPYFLQTRKNRTEMRREAEDDFVPDVSEVREEYRPPEDEEVDQNVTIEDVQRQVEGEYTGAYDAMSITRWMRTNPRQATAKREGTVSATTTRNQFGLPNSDKTGLFYKFMKYLGDEYVEDVRLALRRGAEKHIRNKINAPRRNEQKNPRNEFKDLASTKLEFNTLLIVLRTYPPFKNDLETNQRFKDAYNALDRVSTETEVKVQAIKLQNPKKQLPVMDWNKVVAAIKRTFPNKLSQESIYIDMYDEGVFRDDLGSLFVDTSTQYQVPRVGNKAQIDSIKKNTLFLPNSSTRKNMKQALLVLVDYKTVKQYGKRAFEFSEALTKRILQWWGKRKTESPNEIYLFGSGKMTIWVGKMLDSVGITNRGNANVNYLRRSYRTTAEKSITSEAEREQLAFKFMHSPFASLKYIRELEDVSDLSAEAIELTKDRKFRNQLAKD
jgi:hypothetical protein